MAMGDASPAGGGGGTATGAATEFWADRRKRAKIKVPGRAELLPSQVAKATKPSEYPKHGTTVFEG